MGVESINEYAQLGSVESNEYHVAQSPIYPLDVKFPYMEVKIPLWVIEKSHTVLSKDTLSSTFYMFNKLVAHRLGRGICGFESVMTANRMTGKAAMQFYNPLNYGVLIGEESLGIAKVSYEYNPIVPNNYKQLDITLHKKTVIDRLTNTSSTHTYAYNDYGYPTNETIDYGGGIKTTANTTYQIVSSYIYLPVIQEITHIKPNEQQYSQKTEMAYDIKSLSLVRKQEYVKVGTAAEQKTGETTWTYDNVGNLTSERVIPYTSSIFYATYYTYDNNARFLTKKTDWRGLQMKYSFSSRGLLNWEEDYLGNRTNYSYNTAGELTTTITPDGREIEHKTEWVVFSESGSTAKYFSRKSQAGEPEEIVYYDALHREVETGKQDFNGNWIYAEKEYDNFGRLLQTITPAGTTTYVYDSFDRLKSITDPTGSSTSYTYNGLSVSETKYGLTTTTTTNVLGETVAITSSDGSINYNLRADGQPSSIIAGGITTSFEYDNYGRQTKIIDPSAGMQTYEYNSAGQLWKHTNAKNQTIVMEYDYYGQVTSKQYPEYTVSYTYRNDGALLRQSNGLQQLSYQYDQYLRPTRVTEEIGSKSFVTEYSYTGHRLEEVNYPTLDYSVEYGYNAYGFTDLVTTKENRGNARGGKEIAYTRSTQDGAATYTTKFANRLENVWKYNAYGMPTQFVIKDNLVHEITEDYEYDLLKKLLTNRSHKVTEKISVGGRASTEVISTNTENYTYDIHRRLTGYGSPSDGIWVRPGLGILKSVQYDNKGNITQKSGVGNYSYNSGKPYAISTIDNSDTTVIPHMLQDVSYTSFMRPKSITEGNYTAWFDYGVGDNRCRMELVENGVKQFTRYYFANGKFELTDYYTNGTLDSTDRIFYADGSPYSATIAYTPDRAEKHHYIHRDRMGSVRHISNMAGGIIGTVVATYYYDAWGRQTDSDGNYYDAYTEPRLLLGRGYTGHEHLPWFGLINMNARLYDPVLGRFLSPDPYVQAPDYLQNFNRYSYCVNNPVMLSDPDGEFFWLAAILGAWMGLGHAVATSDDSGWAFVGDCFKGSFVGAVAGTVGALTGGIPQIAGIIPGALAGAGIGALTGAATSVAMNGLSNVINGQNFWDNWQQSALSGAISGGIAGGIRGGIQGFQISKARNLNYWIGRDRAYLGGGKYRSQWSLAWGASDIPDVIEFKSAPYTGPPITNGCLAMDMSSNDTRYTLEMYEYLVEQHSGTMPDGSPGVYYERMYDNLRLQFCTTENINFSEIQSAVTEGYSKLSLSVDGYYDINGGGPSYHRMTVNKAEYVPNKYLKLHVSDWGWGRGVNGVYNYNMVYRIGNTKFNPLYFTFFK